MSTTSTIRTPRNTHPLLLSIDADEPLRLQEVGTRGEGIDWTIQPDRIPAMIEFVNNHGGPNAWRITKLSDHECERETGNRTACGKPAVARPDHTLLCAEHAEAHAWAEANQ